MSLDELRDDLKRNLAEAKRLSSVAEIRDHLVNTMWPFIEANVDVVEEIDDAVGELVEQTEDYLHAGTAAIFAALVQASLELSSELRTRAAGDELLIKKLDNHDLLCTQAMAKLGEITMMPVDDDDDGEQDDEDEEEGADA